MKKTLVMLLSMVLLLCAAGCSNGAGSGEEKDDALQIAILLPSSPTDGGWGQIGAEGLKYAAEQLNTEPIIIEAATADLMKSEAEALAADGVDIIFGHGGQYASPFSEISDNYPETLFISNGGDIVKDNQMPLSISMEQLNYIQGVIGATLSESGKLGVLIGGDFPTYRVASRAFELGAKSVKPDIEVMVGITQDSNDMNEGYELTMSQINAGADVLFSNANQASLGGISAAKEKDTYIFGVINDIQGEAPDQTIASACQDYGAAMVNVAQRYLNGELKPEVITVGIEEGALIWVWNEKVKQTLPEDVVALYDETLEKIQTGEIYVPNEREGWE